MGPATTLSEPRRHRRFLLYGLLVGLTAPAALAGLAWHRARQAEEAVARLQWVGASVTVRIDFPDWWRKLPLFARDSALKELFGRTTCDVLLYGRATNVDTLRTAA